MNQRARAFTLVELLVAMAITTVLTVLLLSIVSSTLNVWAQGRNRIDTFANARQVISRISDELEGAVASGTQIEFSENSTASAFVTGGTTPDKTISENIFFVAPYPNSGPGDLCVIAYRLKADTHSLQRAFIDSQVAWNAGAQKYQIAGYPTFDWRSIAEGTLEFEVLSYSQNDLDTNNIPDPSWNSLGANAAMAGQTPRRVVIRIKLVNDKTLVRLNSMTPGSTSYNQLITSAAREFLADISLKPPR